jgi:hypothetical protein
MMGRTTRVPFPHPRTCKDVDERQSRASPNNPDQQRCLIHFVLKRQFRTIIWFAR